MEAPCVARGELGRTHRVIRVILRGDAGMGAEEWPSESSKASASPKNVLDAQTVAPW